MKYNGETPFNADRTWRRIGQHYNDTETMRELEDAYRTSKIWRWDEDISQDRKFTPVDAMKSVYETIDMWNHEIAPQHKLPKVKPSEHDIKIFADIIYDQFNVPKRKTVVKRVNPAVRDKYDEAPADCVLEVLREKAEIELRTGDSINLADLDYIYEIIAFVADLGSVSKKYANQSGDFLSYWVKEMRDPSMNGKITVLYGDSGETTVTPKELVTQINKILREGNGTVGYTGYLNTFEVDKDYKDEYENFLANKKNNLNGRKVVAPRKKTTTRRPVKKSQAKSHKPFGYLQNSVRKMW